MFNTRGAFDHFAVNDVELIVGSGGRVVERRTVN